MFYAVPFFAMVLALSLAGLSRWSGRALLVVLLLVYGVGLVNYFAGRQFMKPAMAEPWREIQRAIRSRSGADAVVLCSSHGYTCVYHMGESGVALYAPRDWPALELLEPPEVWWIQTHYGESSYASAEDARVLQDLRERYGDPELLHYAPHDPSIRRFKALLAQQEDYSYRVEVLQFTNRR
jgi:hypothetical protein